MEEMDIDEILSSLEEDIELLGDSIEEKKTKEDIRKLFELVQDAVLIPSNHI